MHQESAWVPLSICALHCKESSSVGSALLVFPFYRKEIKAQRTYLAGKKMGQNLKWAWVQNSHSWRPHQMTSTQPLSSLFHVASLLPLCTHCIYSKGRERGLGMGVWEEGYILSEYFLSRSVTIVQIKTAINWVCTLWQTWCMFLLVIVTAAMHTRPLKTI